MLLLQLTAVTAVCTSLLIVERIETAEACFTADASGHYLHQAVILGLLVLVLTVHPCILSLLLHHQHHHLACHACGHQHCQHPCHPCWGVAELQLAYLLLLPPCITEQYHTCHRVRHPDQHIGRLPPCSCLHARSVKDHITGFKPAISQGVLTFHTVKYPHLCCLPTQYVVQR